MKLEKLYITVRGIKNITRATKAIKKMTKSLEKLNKSALAATDSFDKMKASMPAFVEIETENDNG